MSGILRAEKVFIPSTTNALNVLRVVEGIRVDATGATLRQYESGYTWTNGSATTLQTYNLPAAVPGLGISFAVTGTGGMKITAASGDTIRLGAGASSAAGSAESTTVGGVLTLLAADGDTWVAVASTGTWTLT